MTHLCEVQEQGELMYSDRNHIHPSLGRGGWGAFIAKGREEPFWEGGYDPDGDCGGVYVGVYTSVKSH